MLCIYNILPYICLCIDRMQYKSKYHIKGISKYVLQIKSFPIIQTYLMLLKLTNYLCNILYLDCILLKTIFLPDTFFIISLNTVLCIYYSRYAS